LNLAAGSKVLVHKLWLLFVFLNKKDVEELKLELQEARRSKMLHHPN
jgi:hypothetical protein